MRLHQDDIELLLAVAGLDLHRHRLADEIAEHRERLRFFLEEHVDHGLGGEDAELAGVELARFAQDLAQDLVAYGRRGFHRAAPAARLARLAQDVLERLAGALASHLDQAEAAEAVYADAGTVARERLVQLGEDRRAM